MTNYLGYVRNPNKPITRYESEGSASPMHHPVNTEVIGVAQGIEALELALGDPNTWTAEDLPRIRELKRLREEKIKTAGSIDDKAK